MSIGAKWLAGPWSLAFDRGSTRDIIAPDGSPICSVRIHYVTPEQYAANARLIAAAPELAEALQQIAKYPTARADEMGIERARKIASAALAKAGEA
jgi:hypothetical protein